jgi:hypothetical protein
MLFRIIEWDIVKSKYVFWIGKFDSKHDAESAIEYFGHVELIS